MADILGVNCFITWHPPLQAVVVGRIKVSAGKGVILTTQSTISSSQSLRATISLEYGGLGQDELSRWVLFHAFVIGDPWTLPSFMGTIDGVIAPTDKPAGGEKDYDDFLNTAYRTTGITRKMSYAELFDKFTTLSDQQSGMVKNLLLDLKPGSQYAHPEMADYSYWRMVIDFSIVDAIIGQQPFCDEAHQCSTCNKSQLQHYPKAAKEWFKGRLLEIIGDAETAEQYMKIIWTVRQNIRHKTAHDSAYPHERPSSELQRGVNEFDLNAAVSNFETDTHALTALENNMHEVTRNLLLDNILRTKIFPDIRSYMIHSGGMTWDEFLKMVGQG